MGGNQINSGDAMAVMASRERRFCSSSAWSTVARTVILRWALAGETPKGTALEIGAGNGAMAEGMLESFGDLQLHCVDPDPAMVRQAAQRLDAHSGRGVASQGDATDLDFENESFDWVMSFLMLHHVLDWQNALNEAVRVLRPGGMLIGYDLLDHPAVRLGHSLEDSPIRLAGLAELEQEMFRLGGVCTLRPFLGGIGVRFKLRIR